VAGAVWVKRGESARRRNGDLVVCKYDEGFEKVTCPQKFLTALPNATGKNDPRYFLGGGKREKRVAGAFLGEKG
jgi:hypothetical protein